MTWIRAGKRAWACQQGSWNAACSRCGKRGAVGACREEEVHQGMREQLGMSQQQVEEYMREM